MHLLVKFYQILPRRSMAIRKEALSSTGKKKSYYPHYPNPKLSTERDSVPVEEGE